MHALYIWTYRLDSPRFTYILHRYPIAKFRQEYHKATKGIVDKVRCTFGYYLENGRSTHREGGTGSKSCHGTNPVCYVAPFHQLDIDKANDEATNRLKSKTDPGTLILGYAGHRLLLGVCRCNAVNKKYPLFRLNFLKKKQCY